MNDRYFTRAKPGPWQEITKEDFISAEQSAGFHSKGGPGQVATASFSNGVLQGRTVPGEARAEQYSWDPEFAKAAFDDRDLPLTQDGYGVWWLKGEFHEVYIQKRPPYCDRGHYMAQVQPTAKADVTNYSIDGHDGWPRFYMDFGRMVDELRDWLRWREKVAPETESERRVKDGNR